MFTKMLYLEKSLKSPHKLMAQMHPTQINLFSWNNFTCKSAAIASFSDLFPGYLFLLD